MFMSNLRRMAKKNRGVMLAVVVILCIGLLSSYAMMGSWGLNSLKSQISAKEKAVLNQYKVLESAKPDDYYSGYLKLGNLLIDLADLYKRNNESSKSKSALTDAAAAFGEVFKNKPGTLSAEGQADLLSLQAELTYAGGNSTKAEGLYEAAIDCAPLYLQVNKDYFKFLNSTKGENWREVVLEKAEEYQERLIADDPDKVKPATVANMTYIEGLINALESGVEIDWS